MRKIRVTVWNENVHEKEMENVRAIYPDGIHGCIAAFLSCEADIETRTVTLDMPEHGLTEQILDETDVLVWWGHVAHHKVEDEIVDRITDRVNAGMGFVALHSAHASKPFMRLLGTKSSRLRWRENGDKARYWCVAPGHPIAKGLPETFTLPVEETYGEHFNIPEPDHLVYLAWYPGGEVFRAGCCFVRGAGRIFYFQPGHETYPSYHDGNIQNVIVNAVRWVAPEDNNILAGIATGHVQAVEPE